MVAIYARQSVDKKDSISIESQIDFCKKLTNGDCKIYCDKGYSGKNLNRPSLKELIDDVKNGLISKIIVYRLDRISRSLLDFAKLVEFLKKYSVGFVSTQEQFDTSSPIGNAMLSITMVFAQLERETIQQRVTDNYYERCKKGFFGGGTTPYGYNKIETKIAGKKTKTFVENPEQSKIIKSIYDMYTNNVSLSQIARNLNKDGILSPKGTKWDNSKVSRMLRNPIYVCSDINVYNYYKKRGCVCENEPSDYTYGYGCYLYGKREANERKYTDVSSHHLSLAIHEGFIPAEQFVEVQKKMDENKQICNKYKGSYTWLSGLVKCGKCGTGMVVAISKRNDNVSKYFACRGKHLGICTAEKGQKGIHVEDVESEVKKQIFEMVEAKKDLTYKQLIKKNKETTIFETKIKELEEQISNLIVTMSKTSKITSNYISAEIEKLDAEIKIYQEKLEKMKDTKSHETIKQFYDIIEMFDDLNLETKKEIVRKLIEKIHVTHEKIEIVWKYDFL